MADHTASESLAELTSPGRLSDLAYQRILEGLFDRRLPAGAFVSQNDLVKLLGIPVAPLRDALRVLEAEGILAIHPRSGIQFVKPGLELTKSTYQFRTIIERAAVRVFAEIADEAVLAELARRHLAAIALLESKGISAELIADLEALELALHNQVIGCLNNPLIETSYRRMTQLPAAGENGPPADLAAGAALAPRAHGDHPGLSGAQRRQGRSGIAGAFHRGIAATHGTLLMVELFGRSLTRREVGERTGALSQFAGVRLMTLGDGVERGIRMLEFRTGTGLRFTTANSVDRALDIADCEYRGQAIGWHSPAGFRHPGLHEYEGEGGLGWARSFSGLLVTCGLDHTLFMNEVPADNYDYPARKTVKHSLHGRVGTIPARLTGYGERWDGDRCVLWAEGVVQQATVFGEDLHLIRRIEAEVGGNDIWLTDRVVNHGFHRTPHMFMYHINVGHPLLDEGARYLAPIRDVVWAAHADAYRAQQVGFTRQCRSRSSVFASRSGSTKWRLTGREWCQWRWSTTGLALVSR